MATDYRMIINEVRAALEEKAARELYGTPQGTAEQEIANRVMNSLFPALRTALTEMTEINEIWIANDLSDKITAAALAGEPLAGYSPAAWATWGQILPYVVAFLTTEYTAQLPDGSTKTETPKQTLMRRYQQEQA